MSESATPEPTRSVLNKFEQATPEQVASDSVAIDAVPIDSVELETEPAGAAGLFGSQLDVIRTFTNNLADQGEILGLIGPLELPRLWSRHILNCAIVAPLLRPGLVGDVGSGAGLPGLVLAIARPDVNFVLIEPMERRVAWLNDQVAALHLANVTVVRARAEEARLAHPLDQVTARAVSAFSKLIPLTAPLLRAGGELILMKGEGAQREVDAAAKAIRKHRLRDVEVITLGAGVLPEVTRVIRATVD
ncbi:16S rRNA (guanine527-N7)-methyltransferase [Cryobacterium flavum]|uniref:Ribosomal RNA small subunit methyltransferase G n=1 Tax=Cryobacterium flavum TaxID=1424659 RepID=A0A4R8V5S9_9MICO|nr:16S rRNA (guanine(527)-N(7))-methyltransferase RsmG [Cryobacterium flavum]SDM52060.1 16S rRNA (guanine527-N7)-methyltransferase [Cryobacterium flavum]